MGLLGRDQSTMALVFVMLCTVLYIGELGTKRKKFDFKAIIRFKNGLIVGIQELKENLILKLLLGSKMA